MRQLYAGISQQIPQLRAHWEKGNTQSQLHIPSLPAPLPTFCLGTFRPLCREGETKWKATILLRGGGRDQSWGLLRGL